MVRVVVFLVVVVAAATGLAWLADRPGSLVINWEGRVIQTSVFHAVVVLSLLLVATVMIWSILRGVWQMPASVGNLFNRRREKRGLDALSSGMIAIGAGDKSLATRYAIQARKSLPNEPLTHILRAQAAQLAGDRSTSRRIFEAMLASPDTEPLGLRGLFLEAEREGETEAARQFADRAINLNPKVGWPVHALFDIQCKERDWSGALETLAIAKKNGHVEKAVADRKRAVLLTARAQDAEDSDPETAMKLAEEAHALATDLVPASAIAGRLLAARGNVQKATKILQKGWRKGPHPDLATAYAFARIGDSPKDRLSRVQQLAALSPHSIESPVAVASAAIEARDFSAAREALEPLLESRLTQRVCTLMARIEGEDGGNTGAVREWLARAVNAPRDPVWTADGVVADDWAPISPVSGTLDAFEWRVPVEAAVPRDAAILHEKIEELVQLGSSGAPAGAAPPSAALNASSAAAAAAFRTQSSPATAESAPAGLDGPDADTMVDISPAAAEPVEAQAQSKSQAKAQPQDGTSEGRQNGRAPALDAVSTGEAPAAATAPVTDAEVVTAAPQVQERDASGSERNVTKHLEAKARAAAARAEAAAEAAEKATAAATSAATAVAAAASKQDTPSGDDAIEDATVVEVEAASKTNASALEPQTTSSSPTPEKKPLEPNVFISPRAPDDPGPANQDGDSRKKVSFGAG
ncbi:MAG: heme biosynthesis HemY N-terminal domain-containing protein [Pseudomonadota bacterium]